MTGFDAALSSDVYKVFHPAAGHPDIVRTYENFTNRSGKHSNVPNNTHVVNLGWQFLIKKHLIERWNETFFNLPVENVVGRYQMITSSILGYTVDASHLKRLHALGFLPLQIKSYPEGTLVPYGVASATFETTVDGFEWLAGLLETVISQEVWPIQTSATTSLAYKVKQAALFEKTGMDAGLLPFMIHDFSARGMFGEEASAMSAFAHLAVGSIGSDTIAGGMFAEKWYNANWATDFIMASVNATEHSVTCGWMKEGEYEYFKHLMEDVAPTGILAVVSDTWDFWHTVTVIAAQLKDVIMAREGKLVFRPDSGDPADILCGIPSRKTSYFGDEFEEWKEYVADDLDNQFRDNLEAESPHNDETEIYTFNGVSYSVTYEPDLNRHDKQYYYVDNYGSTVSKCIFIEVEMTPENKGLIEVLWDEFGGTTTDKGFKVLDSHVGAIYGDAITLKRQDEIAQRLMDKGFAPQVVLGVGSFSFQHVTRDTHGSAMKATSVTKTSHYPHGISATVDEAIFKDPKTDSKKKSARGLLRVERENGELVQYDNQTREQEQQGELKIIFKNGAYFAEQSLDDIRAVVASQL
jgi:nicotinamide phosphoribosyltransferase